MLILSLTILSLAVSADVANPMRIYSDSNLFRTYISGEFTPSYATTGAYGTTKGKHIEQIYVKAHENAWPNSQMEKATLRNSSVSSNTRQYTYYTCKYFRFLYKGIIIKHNKTEPTYTKTSLFLCEKRRFFMARTEKGVVATI